MRFHELGKKYLQGHNGNQKIVAFCLRKGRILSIGVNSYVKTHPYQSKLAKKVGQPKKEYLHAEIQALLRCGNNIPDCIHVFRFNASGKRVCAAPCPVCSSAIYLVNPKIKVIHS